MFLKNTSGQFVYFTMINVTTGAPVTGITPTCRRCIDGTFAAATGTITEDTGLGFYKMALSQADTNGNDIGYRFLGTGAIDTVVNIVTTSLNPYDATRFGMAALPNANAEAAGGLYTRGTGAGQINQDANGRIDVNVAAISTDATAADNAESFFDGTGYAGTNNVIPLVTTTTTATNLTNAPTNGDLTATMKTSAQTAAAAAITAAALATAAQATAIQADTDDIQTRIPAALVSGRMDASVGAMASNVVTAAAIATDAIGAAEIAAAGANKIADHIIRRTQANARASSDGDAVNSRSMLGMLSLHRNKKDVSGSNLVVKTEDDSTTFFTDALSTDAAAVPIIGVDPA